MKLLTIDSREVAGRPGVLLDSGDILDLAVAPTTLSESQWIPQSVISVIAAGDSGYEGVNRLIAAVDSNREKLLSVGALLPYEGTALMTPVRRPGLILIADDQMSATIKSPNTAVGNASAVNLPKSNSDVFGMLPMVAAVLSRPLYKATEAQADEAIAGFTLLADISALRPAVDANIESWRSYTDSKQFPGACPLGPLIVTRDELSDVATRAAKIAINGVEVVAGSLVPEGKTIAEVVADCSQHYGFRPGDVIGVMSSAGAGEEQKVYATDQVSIAYPGLLELEFSLV